MFTCSYYVFFFQTVSINFPNITFILKKKKKKRNGNTATVTDVRLTLAEVNLG